jgi:hypothetical protein
LIGAGNAVHENGLPSFGEALLFFAHPFDARLCRRRVFLPFQIKFEPGPNYLFKIKFKLGF